jgi:hypothetical protein
VEDVDLDGTSLATLHDLKTDIDDIDDPNIVQHLKVEGTGLIGVDHTKRDFGALQYPWWIINTGNLIANDIIFASIVKTSRSDTHDIKVDANIVPTNTGIGGNAIGIELKPWHKGHFHKGIRPKPIRSKRGR